MKSDLTVIMPVYNEEDCVVEVVLAWIEALRKTGASFELLVLNDGSRDATSARLHALSAPELRVIDKTNEGHGPTILRGYSIAVQQSDWVLQVDSDDELPPEPFALFWAERRGHDMVFGIRRGHAQPSARRLVSAVSRACVRIMCGAGVNDVNVPYRLMRSECLKPMLSAIPANTFAPNVAISGLAVRSGLSIGNLPVQFRQRRTGAPSLVNWSLARNAMKSMAQTVMILWRARECKS